ncbi:DUF1648 domain-containing protein [Lysinibacillus piscis]|uniref:DUF1648 domain-containing protein n=1 Tax=Lysinibacillus piscis TaxID=2518931 RepID=A0ABQ5NL78_9BACI|nr:DUF1648 domain-containing protein [Lysinibacillus sp. KH24]GLC88851.1 hypothetical protein LYSBPC_19780 [Lysinibacillus sp. KH24]
MPSTKKIATPRFCRHLTGLTILIFSAGVVATIMHYSNLPASIPVLQSFTSRDAQFGPKIAIFYLPFVAFMLFLLLQYLEYRATFSQSTETGAQHKNRIMTFCLIKNSILLYFTYSLCNDLAVAFGHPRILQQWQAYAFLALLFGILGIGIIRGLFLTRHVK